MMLGQRVDTRAVRRDATRARLIDKAWELARRDGLGALSFRELAREVGMQAPSLYTYFESKNGLYDALYRDAVTKLSAAMTARPEGATPKETLRNSMQTFLRFCSADPPRYQIIAERPVPGFEPRPESFAIATGTFMRGRADLAAVGVTDDRTIDLWRAITTGLLTQQIANEPGGDRWMRLADEALDMYVAQFGTKGKGKKR